jgi:hypothetical protein
MKRKYNTYNNRNPVVKSVNKKRGRSLSNTTKWKNNKFKSYKGQSQSHVLLIVTNN